MWFVNIRFLGDLGRFEVLSSMNQHSTVSFFGPKCFCVDKKLFHEFQSGLGYEKMKFLCDYGWYCIVFEWFGAVWGALGFFDGPPAKGSGREKSINPRNQ